MRLAASIHRFLVLVLLTIGRLTLALFSPARFIGKQALRASEASADPGVLYAVVRIRIINNGGLNRLREMVSAILDLPRTLSRYEHGQDRFLAPREGGRRGKAKAAIKFETPPRLICLNGISGEV